MVLSKSGAVMVVHQVLSAEVKNCLILMALKYSNSQICCINKWKHPSCNRSNYKSCDLQLKPYGHFHTVYVLGAVSSPGDILGPLGGPLHGENFIVRGGNTSHIYVCDNSQLASLLVTEIISINRFLAL